jgi:hypothetical protein
MRASYGGSSSSSERAGPADCDHYTLAEWYTVRDRRGSISSVYVNNNTQAIELLNITPW